MKKISILTILAAMLTFSSCEDDPILGCTDATAINYDAVATENDGSCELDVNGCTDTLAINYNLLATLDDGSCEYPLFGCMDSLATNYNALATAEDESCLYFSDLIIGSWNGVSVSFTAELSSELLPYLQMMDPVEFMDEFGVEMPTTDEEWDTFIAEGITQNESMEGTIFEFDGTNFTIIDEGELETTTYNFTTTTSFDVGENSLEVESFDILTCTETELILSTEIIDDGMNTSITVTFSK